MITKPHYVSNRNTPDLFRVKLALRIVRNNLIPGANHHNNFALACNYLLVISLYWKLSYLQYYNIEVRDFV
jgi:hypothetical protein